MTAARTRTETGSASGATAPALAGDGGARTAAQEPDGLAALASVDRHTFRTLLGSLATGVSIVTSLGPDGLPRGFTCSSVCSVSAEPPMLLVGISSVSGTLEAIRYGRRFAVNMLSVQGRSLSDLFASDNGSKFADVCWEPGKLTGMPVLQATVAHTECVLERTVEAGDHHLVLGRVVGGTAEFECAPLAYWRGSYRELAHTTRRPCEEDG